MELAPGVYVASYVVERPLGTGAFGSVWQGTHVSSGTSVAMKTLLPGALGNAENVRRFRREAEFLARTKSDHIVQILEFLDDPTYGMILVMEYIHGELLADLFERTILSPEDAIDIGVDILRGVLDLHAARIIHRDLKPANVILRHLPNGGRRAVIFDFSLSRLTNRRASASNVNREELSQFSQLTQANTAIGTLHFMAPEQLLDARGVTEGSDLYAVGAILYRGLAGDYPFKESGSALAHEKLTKEAPRLAIGRDDPVAKRLEEVVGRAMRRRPADRFENARQMLEELVALQHLENDDATLHREAGGALGAAVNAVRSTQPLVVPTPQMNMRGTIPIGSRVPSPPSRVISQNAAKTGAELEATLPPRNRIGAAVEIKSKERGRGGAIAFSVVSFALGLAGGVFLEKLSPLPIGPTAAAAQAAPPVCSSAPAASVAETSVVPSASAPPTLEAPSASANAGAVPGPTTASRSDGGRSDGGRAKDTKDASP